VCSSPTSPPCSRPDIRYGLARAKCSPQTADLTGLLNCRARLRARRQPPVARLRAMARATSVLMIDSDKPEIR